MWPSRKKDGESLIRLTGSWQPYADTRPALIALRRAGCALAIASNTDGAIMEHTLRQLEVPVDVVVTSEDCQAYKPAAAVMEPKP